MPTAAKLVAALCLAATAYGAATMVVYFALPQGPESAGPLGWFREIAGLVGLILGWRILGGGVGRTLWLTLTSAMLATVALIVLCLGLFAFVETMQASLAGQLIGLENAVSAFTNRVAGYLPLYFVPQVWGVLAGGTLVAALLTHLAGRRWR